MNEDMEQKLKAALRPVDPGAGFAAGVLARIAAEPVRAPRPPRARAVASWLSLALAASVVLGLFVAHEQQVQRRQQGLEARRQLIEALRVTGEKLQLASRAVNGQDHAMDSPNPGA